jgi:phage recombination protein Bet
MHTRGVVVNAIVRDLGNMALVQSSAVAPFFTEEQIQLLRGTQCRGMPDADFWLFVRTCERTRLDPFQRQIFTVKRWDGAKQMETWATQVSIDGFRLIADRSGIYEGQTPPQWCGRDGVWRDVWLEPAEPAAARVGALRRGFREPAWGVARFASYVQTKRDGGVNAMWSRMPDVMLAKCAEALALRKAFPAELSGLYAPEELGHIETELAPASSGSPAVRVLGAALHEPDRADAPGPDTLAPVMRLLEACRTRDDVLAWIAKNARTVSQEIDSPRKRDRWKSIGHHAAGVTPPIRKDELTRAFGAALAPPKALPAPAAPAVPADELPSVETREGLWAWFSDHRDWLAGIPQGSEAERAAWTSIRDAATRIGDPDLADELSAQLG